MPVYTKEFVAQQLATDNKWLIRGILAIYARQTDSEQAAGMTHEDNGVGFNGVDSPILSSFAQQIQRWMDTPLNQRRFGIPLSDKQLTVAKRTMKKYAGQLAKIANASQPAAVEAAQGQPPVVCNGTLAPDYDE